MVIVVEEVAKASPALATIAEVQGAMIAYSLMHYAGQELRERWLQPAAGGEKIIAFVSSEPCYGSDAFSLETKAERRGGSWVINGTKLWITSGVYADAFLVAARTGPPEGKHKTVTLFLVERKRCGDNPRRSHGRQRDRHGGGRVPRLRSRRGGSGRRHNLTT
jgi:alkylation response protein AidB-like acyl-CoA dehydrogenase